MDTTRANWLLEQMVKVKRPVVLVGESGTSKTATIQNFLSNLNTDTTVSPLPWLSHKLFKTKNNALQLTLKHRITRCHLFSDNDDHQFLVENNIYGPAENSGGKCWKENQGHIWSSNGQKLLVFMDDLNMPRVRMDLYHRSYLTLNFHLIMDSHLFDLRWMNMALSSL